MTCAARYCEQHHQLLRSFASLSVSPQKYLFNFSHLTNGTPRAFLMVSPLVLALKFTVKEHDVYYPKLRKPPISFASKVFGVILVGVLLVIGIIGIILPIIPGILFLFLAVYVLTRVSRRAATLAHKQPWFSRYARKLDAVGDLPWGQRLKFALLVIGAATLSGVQSLASKLRSVLRK